MCTLSRRFRQDRALLVCVLLIVYTFVIAASAVLSVPQPIGSDTFWHIKIATMIAQGNVTGAYNYIIQQNMFPYGLGISIFHFAEVPLVWSGQPLLFVRVLEMFLLPATYSLVLYLVYRFGGGSKPAAITGIVLSANWAFMDGALQVRPESIDLLLYPVTVLALLTYNKRVFVVNVLVTMYSHGLAAFAPIYGLAANKLREGRWRKTIVWAATLVLPVLFVSGLFFGGVFSKWGGLPNPSENPQEYEFWTQPLTFIPVYAGALLVGVPFLFRRHRTELETLLLWGLVGSLIMVPIWPDRWMHYVSIPLAVFAGMGISRMKQGKLLFGAGVLLLTLLMFYDMTFLHLSLTHTWWQPGN